MVLYARGFEREILAEFNCRNPTECVSHAFEVSISLGEHFSSEDLVYAYT